MNMAIIVEAEAAPNPPVSSDIPWERETTFFGSIPAFLRTWLRLLFKPGKSFANTPEDMTAWPAMKFGMIMITAIGATGAGIGLALCFMKRLFDTSYTADNLIPIPFLFVLIPILLWWPAVILLAAMMRIASKASGIPAPFAELLRVNAYFSAAFLPLNLLSKLPRWTASAGEADAMGIITLTLSILALIWATLATGAAISRRCKVSLFKATATVMLAEILCALILFAVIQVVGALVNSL